MPLLTFSTRNVLILKLIVFCLVGTLVLTFFMAITPLSSSLSNPPSNPSPVVQFPNFDYIHCPPCRENHQSFNHHSRQLESNAGDQKKGWDKHRLAVIVPFRDRFDELLQFIPHMDRFLNQQRISHRFYIINQIDSLRFNRASLINVGFLIARRDCDYIAMHDVDLLPINPQLSYAYPKSGPYHLASPELHPKYYYKTFVGGILLLTNEQFEQVNGLSNRYWGWGLEDDEFYARMKEAKFNITRPTDVITGINGTFLHIHDRQVRKRDTARLFNQKEVTRKRDRITGLTTVQYEYVSGNQMTIDGIAFTVHNVRLICNYSETPWCDLKYAAASQNNGITNQKSKGVSRPSIR